MSLESFNGAHGERQSRGQDISPYLAQKALSAKELLALPKEERDLVMRESADEMCEILRENGGLEYDNLSEMYKALRGEELLVRREDPARLVDVIAGHGEMHIDFPEGERYSNAVEWSPRLDSRGISNAYLEGYGQFNGIVAVAGFRKNEHMDIQALPDAAQVFAGLDREYVRSIQGSYDAEDVLFVSVRIPVNAYPKDKMTERELNAYEEYQETKMAGDARNPPFIHRGFLFTNHKKQ